MIRERLLHRNASSPRSRKMPTCYCVPARIAPDFLQNLFNVISRQTQTINFHMLSNLPVRVGRTRHRLCSAFRVLSGPNTLYSVHVLLNFSTSCHVLIRHVTPHQIAARSLFARRTHSPDMMWWHAATGQMLVGGATCAAQNPNDPIDSGTWPHQFREPHTQVNACLQAARKTQKPQRTLQNNLTTPTVHISMCSDIFGNNGHMP